MKRRVVRLVQSALDSAAKVPLYAESAFAGCTGPVAAVLPEYLTVVIDTVATPKRPRL